MKKPLLNRFSILMAIVVCVTFVFGVFTLNKNRRVATVGDRSSSATSKAEPANGNTDIPSVKAETKKSGSSTVAASAKPKPRKTEEAEERGGEHEQETVMEEDESGSGARENWFYEQRKYPLTTIPLMARVNAIQHMEVEERRLASLRTAQRRLSVQSLPQALPPWQSIGPKPIAQGQVSGGSQIPVPVSGRVTAIALDPGYNGTTNKTIYVGGAQGGVWRSTDNGTNWTPIMDDQPSLAIGAIAIDPADPNTIYVGTGEANLSGDSYYGAGLLKTTNGGASWTVIKGPPSPSIQNAFAFVNVSFSRIVIDPVSPQTIYVAINGNAATNGSTGGSGSGPLDQRGVWKSIDGGTSWTNLDPTNSGGENSATDVIIDPAKHTRIYAAILNIGVLRLDPDLANGQWVNLETLAGSNLPIPANTPFGRVVLAMGPPIAPSIESTIYAVYADTSQANSGRVLGIFRSVDAGNTWTKMNASTPSGGQASYNLTLAVDPTDANTIYFGLQSPPAFRSTDGGQTLTTISNGDGITGGLHADTHVMLVCPTNPNILFTGSDGGIWRSDNAKSTPIKWNDLNQNLSITQFQGLATHPSNPNIILGGTQDNGTNLYGGQISWTRVVSGDGGITLIDQSNPSIMYHTFFNQTNTQIGPEISTTGGGFGTWTFVSQGISLADRVGFYAPMALNTGFNAANNNGNGNVIYFGTHHLYRSSDQAASWKGLGANNDGIGTDLAPPTGRLSAIAPFPFSASSPSTEIVWVGTSNGLVQLTTNAGDIGNATFANLTKAPLPNRFVTDIALDLTNSQRAVITYSGFNTNTPSSPGHVFLTTNQGATFTNISGNLPDVPVTSIAIDPNITNTYYIGTDIGVFRTSDGGTTWEALLSGMPKVAVFMLRYHAATRTLIAATHGRGMFTLDVSAETGNPVPSVTSISPTSASANGVGFTLTVNGSNFVTNSSVWWNGQPRTTTFNNSSQLQAQIPASDLLTGGTIAITVSNPAPGGGISPTSASFLIIGNQTINFSTPGNKTFGDLPFNVNATATSGLPVSFSVLSGPATISGNTVTITGAGTVTIRASQAGNANFNPAPNVDRSFTVAKANQTITFDQPANHTFGDAQFFLSASATSSLNVSFSVISGPAILSGNGVTVTGVGLVTIQASQAGNANFNGAPPLQRTFTVSKANQTITFGALPNKAFGDPSFILNATASSGLFVTYTVVSGNATINVDTVTLTGIGPVTIRADQAGDSKFNAAPSVQQSFTVAKGQASIILAGFVQIFNGTPRPVFARTFPDNLSGLIVTYNGSATAPTAVGKYAVVASFNNPNYQAPNALGTLNIIEFSLVVDQQSVNIGTQGTATLNPSATKPGMSVTLNHVAENNATQPASISLGIFSANPTERGLVDVGGGFISEFVNFSNPGDTAVITYYYPSSITGADEDALQLYYSPTQQTWEPVRGIGNTAPIKDTTDNLDGTVSGGKFTFTVDSSTSSPWVHLIVPFYFSASTGIMGDVNGDNIVSVNDLVLMANILAGNFTPNRAQKAAADVSKDASNNITISDLITLANFLAGNTQTLPVGN